MKDVLPELEIWRAEGTASVLATVVRAAGSTPRAVGARMAVAADGRFVGSVSGGCVEGAVIEEANQIFAGGPPRLVHYGISDEMGWEVGLACGGTIDVFIEPVRW